MKKQTSPKIEIDLARVEELASRGLTNEQITRCLGISERTLYNRKKHDAEFAEAMKRGHAKGLEDITNALFNSAMKGNVTAQIFFLCNRDRESWRNVNRIETTGADGNPIEIKTTKELQGEELVAELAKRGLPTDILEE